MMRPDAKVEKVYLYPKPVGFRKSIDSLAALIELDIKLAVFDPVLLVFLNKPRNRVNILYWERNGFCFWLKRLEESAQAYQAHIVDLKEQIKLLRDRLFGRKSEQIVEPNTPQLALFNEPKSESMPAVGDADEEVVAPTARRGKRKPLSADLPRIEVIYELPGHELTCACCCRKHAIGEEISERRDTVPIQIRVIKHIRKVYGGRGCEAAPVTADKSAQLIEKSMATKYVDGLPLHRFETLLSRHGIDIPRQTLARFIINTSSR